MKNATGWGGEGANFIRKSQFEIYGCERADDLPWKKRREEKEKQVENRAIQDLLFC